MNRNSIDGQNNDDIIEKPQDIIEEDVEDQDDKYNGVVHISCLLCIIKSQFFFESKYCFFQVKSQKFDFKSKVLLTKL